MLFIDFIREGERQAGKPNWSSDLQMSSISNILHNFNIKKEKVYSLDSEIITM